jgi:hypothetical protein
VTKGLDFSQLPKELIQGDYINYELFFCKSLSSFFSLRVPDERKSRQRIFTGLLREANREANQKVEQAKGIGQSIQDAIPEKSDKAGPKSIRLSSTSKEPETIAKIVEKIVSNRIIARKGQEVSNRTPKE